MNKIIKLARERSRDSDFGHAMDHVSLTVELAKYLASKEGADENVCTIAAYLHDIAKNNSRNHGIQGAEEAREFLKEIGASNTLIEKVCYAIAQHDNDLPKETIEAQILWDADKLQSVGPLGFARIFANRMIYVKKDVYYAIGQAKYWEDFFLERFYTDTGRRIATKLHSFMEEFFYLCDVVKQAQLDQVLSPNRYALAHDIEGINKHVACSQRKPVKRDSKLC
jgi:uncharacterized protein